MGNQLAVVLNDEGEAQVGQTQRHQRLADSGFHLVAPAIELPGYVERAVGNRENPVPRFEVREIGVAQFVFVVGRAVRPAVDCKALAWGSSDGPRAGKECGGTCSARWAPYQ